MCLMSQPNMLYSVWISAPFVLFLFYMKLINEINLRQHRPGSIKYTKQAF
jgi:hypothetical protein